jgi:predicted transcriptional regulator
MTKRKETLLLSIIKNSGSVKQLLRENLSYKDISELVTKLVQDELLIYIDEKIVLTEKGKKYLTKNKRLLKETNKENWIKPENKSRIKKHERNFIYLPIQTELDF